MTTQEEVLTAIAKKQQRAARFGLPPVVANDPVSFTQVEREKQRLRMKRFGGPEAYDYFQSPRSAQGTIRSDTLHVHGVDFLSSDQVKSYFDVFFPETVEWLNDSSCNVKFPSSEVALLAFNTNAVSTKLSSLDGFDNALTQAFGYQHEGRSIPLQLRFATDKDVKEAQVSGRESQYYKWRDGLLRKPISRGRKKPLAQEVAELDLDKPN